MEMIIRRRRIEKFSRRGERVLLTDDKHRFLSSEPVENSDTVFISSNKKNRTRNIFHSLRRLSPFLLLGFFLMGLFPYMFITGTGSIDNPLLLIFAFIFLEVNILYIDFVLWYYFKGKKIYKIWLIEIPFTLLVLWLLI